MSTSADEIAREIGGEELVKFFDRVQSEQRKRWNVPDWKTQPVSENDRVNWRDVNAALRSYAGELKAEVSEYKARIRELDKGADVSREWVASDTLDRLQDRIVQLEAEIAQLTEETRGLRWHLAQCEQISGKALNYPWYKDDQKNFPNATEADGVCVGEHVGDTIVEELATAFAREKAEVVRLKAALDEIAAVRLDGTNWKYRYDQLTDAARQEGYDYACSKMRSALSPKDETSR